MFSRWFGEQKSKTAMDVRTEPNDLHQVISDGNENGYPKTSRFGYFSEATSVDKKRIAIIGGGIAGVASVLSLKAEGLEPVCFETRDEPGGTWYYSPESVEGYASTMSTTVLNNSKELSAFSNYPPRKEFNVYMRHNEAYQYYTEYFKLSGVEKHMRLNTEVMRVSKAEDYDKTGRFTVTVKDKRSGKVWSDIYDGVLICTGHFSLTNMVQYEGQERFRGPITHTHSLKDAENFKGQNVLVIGNGCSGLDAADLISTVAKKVYLSTRSGMFIISRLGPRGYPFDHVFLRKYLDVLFIRPFPNFSTWVLETLFLDATFDHRFYAIRPKHHALSKDPIVNDVIFPKLLSGTVVLKGGVKRFEENGVVFEENGDEEEKATEIDSVVMATGYKWSYPFLEEGLLETENGRINLYKCVFPVQLPHPTLAFVGFCNPFGPGVPVGELQARWAAHVLAGKGKLPSRDVMLNDVIERHRKNLGRYSPSDYTSVRVENIPYSDDIASEFGVKPNLLKYFFTDFSLFKKLVFGPFLPYQYRLQGPHSWDGAREAIMSSSERLMWPLTRGKELDKSIFVKISERLVNLIPRDLFV